MSKLSSRGLPLIAALLVAVSAGAALAHDVTSAQLSDELIGADKQAKGGKGAASGAKPDEKPGDDKPFDTVVKDMEVSKGLFTIYRKPEENKTLIEIMPDQLDKMFLFAGTIDQATGERGFYAAMVGADFPFTFHRFGKSVQWIQKNTLFTAPEGSPAARATARSFANAILGSAKILSKPHPDRKSVLVDATELLAAKDLPGIGIGLNQAYQPTNFSFDKERSGVLGAKVFPENILLDVALHFTTDNPRSVSLTLADPRSVPVLLKYQISTLTAAADFKARDADDRVGHFHTVQQDFSSDHPMSPYVRYITRWNLQKTDPTAALSPVKEPIVFWLENTIPLEYRDAIREGTLLWNKAFEKVGFKDAVVVKQQPDDADWDPADIRYNTIRWFAGVDAFFAIGPSRANPFTGQIYDADIGISEGIVRNARRVGEELVSPISTESENHFQSLWSRNARYQCDYADGLAQQAQLGLAVLETRGMLSPEVEQRFMHQYIFELTAHEVGHTLGLRHNFRASSILKADELNDTHKTAEIGQSSSVMDYNPIIIALKGEVQGDFVPTTLGPYDYWAIEYAYKPIEGDDKEELGKIAARAANDPMLPYSTDEDALGTFSAMSIDPLANQYDQATDPLAYFRKRVTMVHELWNTMESRLARPGEGYQILRRAAGRGLNEYNRAVLTSSKFVGGIYHYRDHVGDPGGRSPYMPVPAAKQREALDFLSSAAFAEKAFVVPASVMNKLAVERLPGIDWATYWSIQRLDYPWHAAVLSLQRGVLNRLFHPITLARIQDNELRFGAKERPFRMGDLFSGVNASIWSELDSGTGEITSLRRNLQREHLRQMIRLTVREQTVAPATTSGFGAPAVLPPPPEDATTLARASLVRIQSKIRTRLAAKGAIEATTRAHLQETAARIDAALAAQMSKSVD